MLTRAILTYPYMISSSGSSPLLSKERRNCNYQKAYLSEANEKGIEIYDFYSQHRMFSDILGYLKGD